MYPKYSAYRDSGYDFYGHMPSTWKTEKIKYNSYVKGRQGWQNLRADEYKTVGPFLITGTHFDNAGGVDWDNCHRVSEERYQRDQSIWISQDDVLITKDGTIGKVAHISALPDKACLNSHLLLIRSLGKKYHQRFLFYLLSSICFEGFVSQRQTGTTFFGITQEAVEDFPLALPSLDEQNKIASFLDRETAKIDHLIEKQQQLIELLEEKRQAVIYHAVTKGLNPDAPMKDGGIDWVNSLPIHWRSSSLRWFSVIFAGGTPSKNNESYWNDGTIPWLNSGSVNQGLITRSSAYITEEAFENSSAKWIPESALLIALAGQGKTKGMVAQLGIEATCNQSMAAIIPNAHISPRFLYWWLKSNYQNIRNMAGGDLRDGLNLEIIGSIEFPIPPQPEQAEIAEYLDDVTANIDRLIEKSREVIHLLRERRTALISAAVTGKIDVRDQVPQDVEKEVAS